MLDRIKTFLGKDWEDTQALIQSSLKSDIRLLDATNSAILSNGGKQLRPVLSLLVARACRPAGASPDSIRFAAASELLHNATLLHDDVADNGFVRRGAPTVMSLLGGPASVLIGDYWLVSAVDNILASRTRSTEVIRIFAKTLRDLAEGEMLQLQKAGSCDTTEEDYLRIIYNKTASLFEAAGVSAAVSVDAPRDVVEVVREYCVALGMAFQIKDDIFDYSDGKGLGKPVGADLDESKITLPLLGALRRTGSQEEARVRSLVRDIPSSPSNKLEIIDFVHRFDGVGYAVGRLGDFTTKAVEAIGKLPDSEEKDYLVRIARFTAERNK